MYLKYNSQIHEMSHDDIKGIFLDVSWQITSER